MKTGCLTILMTLIFCASCTKDKVYHHYNHTSVTGWERVDTLAFDVAPVTDGGRYGTDLGLRISTLYPFTSLTLIVEQTVYPAHTQQTDTLTCKLTDKNGKTKGQGISYYQYHFHVSQMQLQRNDSLHITVRHNMKRELLPGIADIGIALNRLR